MMQFACEIVLNEIIVEDLNASFAAQHGLSITSVNECKEKINRWDNCDPGK